MWPVEYQMQFETDDEYINNLFKMSSATLHTSMHRFYLDGVKRDFLPVDGCTGQHTGRRLPVR